MARIGLVGLILADFWAHWAAEGDGKISENQSWLS
jgi:hypothetical protein